jgi:amidase
MKLRAFLLPAVVLSASTLALAAQKPAKPLAPAPMPFSVVEATIPEMRPRDGRRRVTSRELVTQYLHPHRDLRGPLNAVIAVNPDALEGSRRLDRERAAGKVRGPLHGIPVALKDNIHTTDMPTTGGALAFAGFTPVRGDAHEEPARRGRDHPRQDRPDGARQLGRRRACPATTTRSRATA